MLGAHTAVAGSQPGHLWQARLVPQAKPYPRSHRFGGVEIVPLSVLLETLSVAAKECGAAAISDVRFELPIAVDEPRVVQVFTEGDTITVSSASQSGAGSADPRWIRHVSARVSYEAADSSASEADAAADVSGYDPSALAELHNAWGIEGLAYPWSVSSHEAGPGRLHAVVDLPDGSPVALLDAAVNLARLVDASSPGLKVPSSAEAVVFGTGVPVAQGVVDARMRGRDGDDLILDVAITAADGTPYVDIRAMRYTAVETGAVADADPIRVAHTLDWQPWTAGTDASQSESATVAVLGSSALADAVRENLVGAGHRVPTPPRHVTSSTSPTREPSARTPIRMSRSGSPPRSPTSSAALPSATHATRRRCGSSPGASTKPPPTTRCARAACGAWPGWSAPSSRSCGAAWSTSPPAKTQTPLPISQGAVDADQVDRGPARRELLTSVLAAITAEPVRETCAAGPTRPT